MKTKLAFVAMAALGVALVSPPAEAAHRHHHQSSRHATTRHHHRSAHTSVRHHRDHHSHYARRRVRFNHPVSEAGAPEQGWSLFGAIGSGGSSLLSTAKQYLGTNPTGWASVWCGKFMDMVLRRTGHEGGGNVALAYQHYGRAAAGPEVGAIAVMGRSGGGHVGIVDGFCDDGRVKIISGNHGHKVGEGCYSRGRIKAYRLAA